MLFAQGINKYYGNLQVLQGVDLTVAKGEIDIVACASYARQAGQRHIATRWHRPSDTARKKASCF